MISQADVEEDAHASVKVPQADVEEDFINETIPD